MELTFVTELGQTFVVEIDPNMQLEDVMALLEAEVRPCHSHSRHPATFLIHQFLDSLGSL